MARRTSVTHINKRIIGGGIIKSIQGGFADITNTADSDVTINAVDTNKSLVYTKANLSTAPFAGYPRTVFTDGTATLLNSTTMRIYNYNPRTDVINTYLRVFWQVVEYE